MIEILKKIGISEKTINHMIEICPNIEELREESILKKIEILKNENCDKTEIRNIISSNSSYLDKSDTDIEKLIKKMKEFGFSELNLLFDGNPYILNLDDFEIENYINKRKEKGELLEDIVDDMSSNLLLFNEV